MHTYIHTYIHTNIHTYIHTYIHAHILGSIAIYSVKKTKNNKKKTPTNFNPVGLADFR